MNTNQIACFIEAAKEKNFTKAAEKMYISQPAISRTISALEKELNVKLFNRLSNKKIELTTAGKIYFECFQKSKQDLLNAESLAFKFSNPDSVQITIGFASGWSPTAFLTDAIDAFYEDYPNVRISFHSDDFDQLCDKLAKERLDAILLLDNNVPRYSDIITRQVTKTERIIMYSDRYIKRYGEVLSPNDLKDAVFFVPEFSNFPDWSENIRDFCSPYNFSPYLFVVENMHTVFSLVELGEGVAFSDAWSVATKQEHFHILPLGTYHKVCLSYRKGVKEKYINSLFTKIQEANNVKEDL